MRKLLFIMMVPALCMAGNIFLEIPMFWINVEHPQFITEDKQQYSHQKRSDHYNNHHYKQTRNKQHNPRINQPRSNNYAAKNRR